MHLGIEACQSWPWGLEAGARNLSRCMEPSLVEPLSSRPSNWPGACDAYARKGVLMQTQSKGWILAAVLVLLGAGACGAGTLDVGDRNTLVDRAIPVVIGKELNRAVTAGNARHDPR